MSILVPLLLLTFIGFCESQNNSNKVWILLSDTSVYSCRGSKFAYMSLFWENFDKIFPFRKIKKKFISVTNKLQMSEKDVSVRNQQGRQVHYLEAPGTYVLNFRNIRVEEPLPNLSGQLNGVLQVPIGVGNVLNWDFPYSIMPEKGVFGGYHCDKASGAVTDNGKQYWSVFVINFSMGSP